MTARYLTRGISFDRASRADFDRLEAAHEARIEAEYTRRYDEPADVRAYLDERWGE